MTATIYIVGWDGARLMSTRKASIPAMTTKHLVEYFSTRMSVVGTHGVILNSKGNPVLEWGWKMGHKEIKFIPTYVPGWEMYASKQRIAEYKKRGY